MCRGLTNKKLERQEMSNPANTPEEVARLKLADEYVDIKMAMMTEDSEITELAYYAKQALEAESLTLTAEELEDLIQAVKEYNGDEDEELDDEEAE
jgi:hypothetical protein